MRIKHTKTESWKIYYKLSSLGGSYINSKTWAFASSCYTKKTALNRVKRYKNEYEFRGFKNVIFKIVWCPSPFAENDTYITVYTDEVNENEK